MYQTERKKVVHQLCDSLHSLRERGKIIFWVMQILDLYLVDGVNDSNKK